MSDHDQTIPELLDQLACLALRLVVAQDGEAMAHAALAVMRQQAAAFNASGIVDDMDAANEPDDPPDSRPVMPANALRRQHAPGGIWTPDGAKPPPRSAASTATASATRKSGRCG
jgi:hypothetical protein